MIIKPKGTVDIIDEEARIWKYVEELIDSMMEKYNYNYIRTPIFEASELFHRGIGNTSDIVTKETYDFKDRGDRSLTLRPEGTAGVVRSFIENKMYGTHNLPVKVYYNGTMYRYERPQLGRNRELTQFGVEVLGSRDPMMDAEVISLSYNLMKMLGLNDVVIHINSLGDKESRDNYREALKNYFEPYLDQLCEDCKNRFHKNPLRIIDCKVDSSKEFFKKAPSILDYLNKESKDYLDKVLEYLDILEVKYVVDDKIVRGLDYYNHTVFEIMGEDGKLALGAGGRYDNLVKDLGGPDTPCVGFAMGLDRLVLTLRERDIKLPLKDNAEIFVMYINEEEKKYAIYIANELRMAGFRVETEYTARNLKSQFKRADYFNSSYLIILNSDDLNEGLVTIKNNKTKEEEKIMLEYLIYYFDEHLDDDEHSESEENHE
ncbi:MAG TPA: histidine--tRNA ligase [Candidatus Onthousia faecavium]|nr:histidine--tRNA ligase [Candidatus Onthousia faecavium]